MKLYTYDPAPNPRRLGLFLAYKGIHLETEQVDLMKGEQLRDGFRAINPACTVPALVVEDEEVLSEVIGICTLLEELYPEKPLLGVTPMEKARIYGADHHLYLTLLMPIAEVLRNGSPAFANRALPGPLDVPQIEALVQRGRLCLAQAWKDLDRTLSERDWVAGDSPSMADIDALVGVEFAGWVKESVPAECTHLNAWLERARETFRSP